jgi:UDP-N-acetyl-2-amino-2-deoxyglucuronate dehydrogenase
MYNFGMTGVAGYVAPRHLQAIHETGNNLAAALDPHDSVGIIDKYFPECKFFTEPERFDRHLEKIKKSRNGIDYLTICSPNYLHDAHCRLALRVGANAICEKPLVINPWNLNQLKELEEEYGKKIFVILQLRLDPDLIKLKNNIGRYHKVVINYITPRGNWYLNSWKGDEKKSGGLVTNIGIHLFDMMAWLFGKPESFVVSILNEDTVAGNIWLEHASVTFYLSIIGNATRSIEIDSQGMQFGNNFTNLHTEVYKDILSGGGFGIEDARVSIELTHLLRSSKQCKYTKVAM